MMNRQDPVAAEFLYYNRWANLKLIDACAKLTEDQLASSSPGSYGSIYDTLEHIIRAEAGYYRRLTGTRLDPPFSWDDHPYLAEIRPYTEQVSSALLEAAGRMGNTDIFKDEWQGQSHQYKATALLIQVINHGVEHRTNITTILAGQGIQPPDIDGWGYIESNPDRMGA